MWNRIIAWCEVYGRHRAAHAVMDNLNRLTDRELKDIGICRGDIRNYAYTGKTNGNL